MRELQQYGRPFNTTKWSCCQSCGTFCHCEPFLLTFTLCLGMLACCFPPCYAGYLFDRVGSRFLAGCCHVTPSVTLRSYYRAINNVRGSLCVDCMFGTFCFPCAMVQMKNDMDSNGF
ncbi:placenta-specific 8 [Cichlidogyrus casuarinus]|uniref:Placenta-specific 8 n=1 Tax=Cichlidogyrus casuarinus TaxID=1844966 RepID=A0ABD2PWQ9_9PLAT